MYTLPVRAEYIAASELHEVGIVGIISPVAHAILGGFGFHSKLAIYKPAVV